MKKLALAVLLFTLAIPVFAQQTSNKLTFTVNNPAPTVTSLSPNTAIAGASATALTITGTGFNASTTVTWGTTSLTVGSETSTGITTTVPATLLASSGSFTVTVTNPAPGGGSTTSTFTVSLPATPVPSLTLVSPVAVLAGSVDTTVTFTGSNFQSNIQAFFQNGSGTPVSLATTFVSTTSVTAVIPAAQMAVAGTFSVYVINPGGVVAHNVTVKFTASSTAGAGAIIARGTKTGGPYTTLTSTPIPSGTLQYTDSTVAAGATYFYVGYGTLGGVNSVVSNELSATIPTP